MEEEGKKEYFTAKQKMYIQKMLIRVNIGLMGVSFAFLLALLQVQTLDTHLLSALMICSVIFPFGFCFGFILQIKEKHPLGKTMFRVLIVETLLLVNATVWGLWDFIDHFSEDVGGGYDNWLCFSLFNLFVM